MAYQYAHRTAILRPRKPRKQATTPTTVPPAAKTSRNEGVR
jgi:hypothetical protein